MTGKFSPKTALAKLLGSSLRPVYALDERRRIVYCNPACAQWLGLPATALLGQRCDYHSGGELPGPSDSAAGLCPPPEVFAGQRTKGEISCRGAAGQLLRRQAEFVPLPKEQSDRYVVLVLADAEDLPAATAVGGSAILSEPVALHQRLRLILHELRGRHRLNQVVGDSPAIVRVREQIRLAMAGVANVVVVGPTGSGCEHIARAIHFGRGGAAAPPLTPLACPLLDTELLQSALTSFIASCAELQTEQPPALLLLEVEHLAADAQAALAGMLGGGSLHLRALTTARTPLLQLAAEGLFRRDLAFILSPLVIEVPPLAQRPQDIPLLAQLFLEQGNAEGDKQLAGFAEDAWEQLLEYPWPGNVDELAELVRAAGRVATGPLVSASALPERIRLTAEVAGRPVRGPAPIELDKFLAEIELELLRRALAQAKGNKAEAARLLGISRARLLRRLEFFGRT